MGGMPAPVRLASRDAGAAEGERRFPQARLPGGLDTCPKEGVVHCLSQTVVAGHQDSLLSADQGIGEVGREGADVFLDSFEDALGVGAVEAAGEALAHIEGVDEVEKVLDEEPLCEWTATP